MLQRGSYGPEVADLQLKLRALGYYKGGIDKDYGPQTTAAVLAFQLDYESLVDDAKAGPYTLAKIDQALAIRDAAVKPRPTAASPIACNDETWSAWTKLVGLITGTPVGYGPGRGLFVDGKFVITRGPGSLKADAWSSPIGKTYPSFHCTSWCNMSLAWLLRRNDLYTHAGNVPSLFELLETSGLREIPQDGWTLRYRGYGDETTPIVPDGTGAKRVGQAKVMDARELYARRESLPTFVVFAQSTMIGGKVKWWHHTGLYVVDHRDNHRMYRIAADGFYGAGGWSAQPMKYTEITGKNLSALDGAFYQCWGVDERADGSYGDLARPIADVVLEQR